jgi:hypothetical protein
MGIHIFILITLSAHRAEIPFFMFLCGTFCFGDFFLYFSIFERLNTYLLKKWEK